mgnify:CR=1 FL=1
MMPSIRSLSLRQSQPLVAARPGPEGVGADTGTDARAPWKRWLGWAAALLVLTTLAACSLSRPAPVKRMFLLEAAPPPSAGATRTTSIRIGVIAVAAPFRGKTLAYRRDDVTFESDFYSEFFASPAAMVAGETAKALNAAKVFGRVVGAGTVPDDADYVLDGFVSEMYGDLREAGKPAAVLTATFYLSAGNVTPARVLWSREYRQRVVAADSSPEALARAWNAALTAMLAELARDLAAEKLPPP